MPVGSGPGPGTPPPTDAGVCAISPSDLVGFVGNALSRIKELEQRVAELEAANVEANQLSDLATQVGWVGGVTYMGIEGWTQTEYGTLIPPPGVTLSTLGIIPPTIPGSTSGVQFQITDANGLAVFGADVLGQLFGTYVDIWNGTASPEQDYCDVVRAPGFGHNHTNLRGMSLVLATTSGQAKIYVQVSRAGLYTFSGNVTLSTSSVESRVAVSLCNDEEAQCTQEAYSPLSDPSGINVVTASISRTMYLATDNAIVSFQSGVLSVGTSIYSFALSGARISD